MKFGYWENFLLDLKEKLKLEVFMSYRQLVGQISLITMNRFVWCLSVFLHAQPRCFLIRLWLPLADSSSSQKAQGCTFE